MLQNIIILMISVPIYFLLTILIGKNLSLEHFLGITIIVALLTWRSK